MSVEGKKNAWESTKDSDTNTPGRRKANPVVYPSEGVYADDATCKTKSDGTKSNKASEELGIFRLLIKAMFRLRDRRNSFLPGKLVDDAAFSMLLDLYDTYVDEKQINVSALCANAGAPGTTALRRLDELIELGLAARVPDKTDARRILVIITAKGADLVRSYLREMYEELAAILDN